MKKKAIPVLVCIAVLAVCIGIFQYVSQDADKNIVKDVFEQAAIAENDISAYTEAVEDAVNDQIGSPTTETPSQSTVSTTPARVENGLLTIGNPTAPVTIMEFSSLSCPHCASFHKNTLGAIKTDYIDTGKVKIIFYDFPLNQQALHGTLLLRCAKGNDRYALMEMLFDQQAQWAFEGDHQTKLKQYASLLGISSDKADACMSDTTAEQEVLKSMKAASVEYKIQSTPSFVIIPDQKMMVGAQAYGAFSTEIEKRLK